MIPGWPSRCGFYSSQLLARRSSSRGTYERVALDGCVIFADVADLTSRLTQACRSRRVLYAYGKLWGAANLDQSFPVPLHFAVMRHPGHRFLQYSRRVLVLRLNDSVMHPGTISSCADDSCSTQVGEVPADLRLIRL
jgi:hypothetical protein